MVGDKGATGDARTDYVAGLDVNALSGMRVGVMNFTRNDHGDINRLFDAALADMERRPARSSSTSKTSISRPKISGANRSTF